MNSEIKNLKDGRKLSYCEIGNRIGEPVFYFHGFPGSHLELAFFDGEKVAIEHRLRVIAVNRPGYSHSDSSPNRNLLDWPDDIAELALLLGIDKFSVIGLSGGGPYAIACAYKIPDLIRRVAVVSGMGPIYAPCVKEVPSWFIIKWPGFIQKIIINSIKNMVLNNPDKFLLNMTNSPSKTDQNFMKDIAVQKCIINFMKEAFITGGKGAIADARIYKNNWGFELEDVKHEIFLYHGEDDSNVKIETAKYLSNAIPACISKFYPDEGHFSLIGNNAMEIFREFVHK